MQYQEREHLTTDYELLYNLYSSDRYYSYSEERQKLIRIYLKAQKKYEKYEKIVEDIEYKIDQFENDGSSSYYSNIIEYEKQLQNYKKLYSLYHNCVIKLYKKESFKKVLKLETHYYIEEERRKRRKYLKKRDNPNYSILKNDETIFLNHKKNEFEEGYLIESVNDYLLLKYSINRKEYKMAKRLIDLFHSIKSMEEKTNSLYIQFQKEVIILNEEQFRNDHLTEIYENTKNNTSIGQQTFFAKSELLKKQKEYNDIYNSIEIQNIIKRINSKNYNKNSYKKTFNIIIKISVIIGIIAITAIIISIYIINHNKPKQVRDSINLISKTATVSPGKFAEIEIKGDPNTEYYIVVEYNSGYSKADGLDIKTTDSSGYVNWEWKVGAKTHSGRYPITITNKQTFYDETFYFTVE